MEFELEIGKLQEGGDLNCRISIMILNRNQNKIKNLKEWKRFFLFLIHIKRDGGGGDKTQEEQGVRILRFQVITFTRSTTNDSRYLTYLL